MVKTLSVFAVLLSATTAFGDFAQIPGATTPSQGWSQRFAESGAVFDFIAIEWHDGSHFQSPGFQYFADPDPLYPNDPSAPADLSWAALSTPYLANGYGDFVAALQFDITFSGSATDGADFYFYAWNDGYLVEDVHAVYNSGWTFPALGEHEAPIQANYTIVPVPGAALLGALGLSLVGWVKRRLI